MNDSKLLRLIQRLQGQGVDVSDPTDADDPTDPAVVARAQRDADYALKNWKPANDRADETRRFDDLADQSTKILGGTKPPPVTTDTDEEDDEARAEMEDYRRRRAGRAKRGEDPNKSHIMVKSGDWFEELGPGGKTR